MLRRSRRRHAHSRLLVAVAALAALGCAGTPPQRADRESHETAPASVDANAPDAAPDAKALEPGVAPNDDVVAESARTCERIGDGLVPRFVAARSGPRADFGNSWVRYTFQCEPGDEGQEDASQAANVEEPG